MPITKEKLIYIWYGEHLTNGKSCLIHHFLNICFQRNSIVFSLQIYSVVNGVAHVVIYARNVNINVALIDEELADCCEENYMSKVREVWRENSCDFIIRI